LGLVGFVESPQVHVAGNGKAVLQCFSGRLSVDSVSDGEMEMWFATDPLNRDLILGHHRAKSADKESLVAFLTELRDKYAAELINGWCERYPDLGTFRQFILDFYALMSCKDAASADLLRKAFLARWEEEGKTDAHFAHALKLFGDDKWFARLFPFTAFDNAHRTTNSTEWANRWFRKRQKTHYRNRTEPTIRNMLHADLIYHRKRTPDGEPPVRLVEKRLNEQRSA